MIKHVLKPLRNEQGFTMAIVLAITVVLAALGVALAGIANSNYRFTAHEQKSANALNVAEAGVNYYLWHLSHNTTDYCDGAASCSGSGPFGPYVHNYYDTSGKLIGTYTLTITPPTTGSTVTTVKSVGQVAGLNGTRTILAQLGIPSFASYVLLTDSQVWFGNGENTSGPVHGNKGVHFDAVNNGPVTAGVASYIPSSQTGGNGSTTRNGVWGNGGPTAQWQYPVPTVDFNAVTANLQSLKTSAQSTGVYLAALGAFSSSRGYYLKLKSNGTIDIYKVTAENSSGITTTFVRNQSAPANGIMYVEDNVWVDGTYNGRITIASGRLPSSAATDTSIKVTSNLLYTAKDGSVAVGLIGQNDVQIAQYAPNSFELDAALLAQKGAVYMPNYNQLKGTLTFYGALATAGQWTWSYCSGNPCNAVSGYVTNTNTFDTNLKFAPPPSFPVTGTYTILNWRELLYNP